MLNSILNPLQLPFRDDPWLVQINEAFHRSASTRLGHHQAEKGQIRTEFNNQASLRVIRSAYIAARLTSLEGLTRR